jgi:small basic protein (TIGR04137 family)
MTQRASFKRRAAKKRTVLKRHEHVDLMTKRGKWSDSSVIVGMPKTKLES